MELEDWMPLYRQILKDFSFSEEEDAFAAELLLAMVREGCGTTAEELARSIGPIVTVCGGADSLRDDIEANGLEGTIIAAGGATKVLLSRGIVPTILVTDLDGPVEAEVKANCEGAIAMIHAHGDNMPLIRAWAPRFRGLIVPTCQTLPSKGMFNFGGFTDGDRAVIVARHFGAKKVRLLGFDFLNPSMKEGSSKEIKKRKLAWARRLIFDLNPPEVELWSPRPI